MSRELLQQALDALGTSTWDHTRAVGKQELIDALRSALAAPQPEPVAEVIDREHQPWEHGKHTSWLVNPSDLPAGTKLYAAAPPAVPAPVVPNLAHKPTVQHLMDLARKFRSAPGDLYDGPYKALQDACYAALSAAPVVREPLTDAQIDKIFDDAHENMPKGELFRTFVTRAIERAHGIGGGGK